MKQARSGGGWQAIRYSLQKAKEVGPLRLWRAMRSNNACKTCALGMGGQLGGMTNEARHFPEVCKKSFQAMTSDMQGRIEPRFWATYSISELRGLSSRELEMSGRLVDPVILKPGATHFKPISWEEAFAHAGSKLKATKPERTFFYSSGRSSNEAGFILHLLARSHGTNHLSNCSYYCHQASGVGLADSIGTGTATVSLADLEACDLVFLIGGNPASNHPRLMTSLMRLRERGGKVIVINPVREVGLVNFRVPSSLKSMLLGSEIASLYLQPTIGGDIALLIGIAKALLSDLSVDTDYIESYTEGFEAVRNLVANADWQSLEALSGVSRDEMTQAAKLYAQSKRTIFAWTMGITHHEHGVENVQWIANLALLRGMVGKPGAGLMPIRGHSNVQGLGSMGVSPVVREAAMGRLRELGIAPPAWKGTDTMGAMEASARGEMDFALCLGGNLYGANPDATFASASLGNLDTVVYLSTTLNTGHVHGTGQTTLILPVLARDEEPQSTTQESMFNYVRLSDGGPRRHDGPMSEVEVLASIAVAGCEPNLTLNWEGLKSHDAIRTLIARLVPGFEQLEAIGETKQEFEIPGRILKEPVFATASGKASFKAHPIPSQRALESSELRLMTVRSEGQFNTVVYEEKDVYRGQERRDVILLNRLDRERLGLTPNQPVRVSNGTGVMDPVLVRDFEIARGCALMYYPEANVLIPRDIDVRSRTPAFKSAVVKIEPSKFLAKDAEEEQALGRSGLKAC